MSTGWRINEIERANGHILVSPEVLRRWEAILSIGGSIPPTLWGWTVQESSNLPDNVAVVAPISVGNVHVHAGFGGGLYSSDDALLESVNDSVIAFQNGTWGVDLPDMRALDNEGEEDSMGEEDDEVMNPWEIIEHDVGWEKTGIQIKIQHKKTGEIKMCRLTVEDIGWLHSLQEETKEGDNWKPRS